MEIAELYPAEKMKLAEKMKPRRRFKCSSCSAPAYLKKKKTNNSPRSEKKEQKPKKKR